MAPATQMLERRRLGSRLSARKAIYVILIGLLRISLAGRANGQVPPAAAMESPEFRTGLWGKNALGGQIGPWFSSNLTATESDPNFHLTANSSAFHLEVFYQPHLSGIANFDLSLGSVSRGEMRIRTATQSSYGTATIYPIGLGVRLAPFARKVDWPVQPIIRLGGTVLVGTEQFESALRFPNGAYYGTSIQSHWALGYYGGAGFAWILGEKFALTACVKYQHARFTKDVFGAKDYSGVQVLIGGMYLYRSIPHRQFTH